MALNLPPSSYVQKNQAFKSSGENNVVVQADGQMTDTKIIFHATAEQTNGAVGVTEVFWNPGDKAAHHLHRLEDEGFFVIEGSMTLHTPEGDVELGPGEFGWGPRNVRHAYSIGPEGAHVLVVQVPGTQLHWFFRGIANLGALQGREDFEEFAAWAEENFGATFYDPIQYPPGQSVPDRDHATAGG